MERKRANRFGVPGRHDHEQRHRPGRSGRRAGGSGGGGLIGATGVVAGTYPTVTVDAKGRVTGGTTLVSGDIPAHTHVAIDIVSGALPFTIQKAGTAIGTRRALNLIEGANITLTVADDSGNDRANVTVAAASGASTYNLLSATHPDTVAAAPVLGDRVAANGTPAWARLAGNATATWKFLRQTGTSTVSALPAWDTLLAGDLPAHTHAESDVTSLATDLTNRPVKGGAWPVSKAAVINSSGQLDGAAGTATDCVLVNGTSAAKANVAHTHAATDIVSGTLDNARTSGTASATASTLVLRNGSDGASFGYLAANNQRAYLGSHFQSFECGAFQTVGGAFENMAKYSEDFTVAVMGQERRLLLGHREQHRRAGRQHDRRHHHGGDRDANHPAAGGWPGLRRPVHLLRLGQDNIRNEAGIHRHRVQRLCRLPGWADKHHAHDRLAAVQDHRQARGRADRALDRRAPVRRHPGITS